MEYIFIVVAIGIVIYFLPTFIVCCNDKTDKTTLVILLNIFVGWSLIGWIIALILAFSKDKIKVEVEVKKEKEESEFTKELKKNGVI